MRRKITDEELIREYKKGLSDGRIAKKFNCATSTIQKRRYKLKLIANYKNWEGKRLNEEECDKIHRKILKKTGKFKHKKWENDSNFREKEFERDRIRKLGKLRAFFIKWLKKGVKENQILRLKAKDQFLSTQGVIIIDRDYFLKLKERMGGLGK